MTHSLKNITSATSLSPAYSSPIEQSIKDKESIHHKNGEKFLNLVKLDTLCKASKWSDVEVPKFLAIDSCKIFSFLEKNSRVFQEWKTLCSLYNPSHKNFLEEENVKALLQSIDQSLSQAFHQKEASQLVEGLESWIGSIEKSGAHFMVRSCGDEDDKNVSNAGGNASFSYVNPNKLDLSLAIGSVVRSYFSVASLQNRLNAGQNPFSEQLTLSVLIQEMVGEASGSNVPEIPVSMVLFTNEPLYVGKEQFNVMRMSATYGNGEAVVNNKEIATDTILVMQSLSRPSKLYIQYDNREKPFRLGPISNSKGIEVAKLPNSNPNKRALNNRMLKRLFDIGMEIEKGFKEPANVEIVIKGDKIYLVQARPIVKKVKETETKFLDLTRIPSNLNPIMRLENGTMIVQGHMSVEQCLDKGSILVAETLKEAEKKFRQGSHKLVIVSTEEPANSHPVVNFSSMGIPCVQLKNKGNIEAILKSVSESSPLMLCTQTGTIALWNKQVLDPSQFIVAGCIEHPVRIPISLPVSIAPESGFVPSSTPEDIKKLLAEANASVTKEIALSHLQTLKKHEWISNIKLQKMKLIAKANAMASQGVKEIIKLLGQLEKKVDRAFEEALAAAAAGKRMQLHFHLKILKLLLIPSENQLGRSVGQFVVGDVAPLSAKAMELIGYQSVLKHQAHFDEFLFAAQNAPRAIADKWRKFIGDLEESSSTLSKKESDDFRLLIKKLIACAAFPNWLCVQFDYDGLNETAAQCVKRFLNTITDFDEKLLLKFEELQKDQKIFSQLPNMFEAPSDFSHSFNALKHVADKWKNSSLLNDIKKSSSMTKMAALGMMQQFVNSFDLFVKKLKSNLEYPLKDKLLHIEAMVSLFFNLYENWIQALPNSASIPAHTRFPIPEYLKTLKTQLDKLIRTCGQEDNAIQKFLLPSQDFNVHGSVLGAKTDLSRHLPETIEDFFTLTHQNLLGCISALHNELIPSQNLQKAPIPQKLKDAVKALESWNERVPMQRMGLEMGSKELKFKYNVPLRNHSAQLEIIHQQHEDKVILKMFFMGHGPYRWNAIKAFSQVLHMDRLATLAKPIDNGFLGLEAAWELTPDNFNLLMKAFQEMIALSNNPNSFVLDMKNRFLAFFSQTSEIAFAKEYDKKAASQVKENAADFFLEQENTIALNTSKNAYNDIPFDEEAYQFFQVLYKFKRASGATFEAALKAGFYLESHSNARMQNFAFKLFRDILKAKSPLTNEMYDKLLKIALKQVENVQNRVEALNLITCLAENIADNQVESVFTSIKAIKEPDPSVVASMLSAISAIFGCSKNLSSSQIDYSLQLASHPMISNVSPLVNALNKKNLLKEAVVILKNSSKSQTNQTEYAALFRKSFEKQLGFQEAEEIAATGLCSQDDVKIQQALRLFELLFEYERGHQTALELGLKLKNSERMQNIALELFTKIVEASYKIPQDLIEKILQFGLDSFSNNSRSYSALILLAALVKANYVVEQPQIEVILKALKSGLNDERESMKQMALQIIGEALHHENLRPAFSKFAFETASNVLKHASEDSQTEAVKVLILLGTNVSYNDAVKKALAVFVASGDFSEGCFLANNYLKQ